MLDPLSALSLAATIVQFVDFGSKLITSGYEAYASLEGAKAENVHIETITEDLSSLSKKLIDPLPSYLPQSEDDVKLQELAAKCRKLAEKLLGVLEDLKVKGQGPLRGWETCRKTIKAALKSDKIKKMEGQLKEYRDAANSRILSILRNNQSSVLQALRRIEDDGARMRVRTANQLEDLRRDLLNFLSNQAGETATIQNAVQDNKADISQMLRQQFITNRVLDKLFKLVDRGSAIETGNKILDSLRFNGMQTRYTTIHENYPETFQWIFKDNQTPFKAWLKSGSGTFWVNGKAGSGKSTLMKFLSTNKETELLLKLWAGQDKAELIIASYYFWIAGSPMQKSQEGLLQSLLFQLLRSCPEAIATVCPQRWQADESFHSHPDPWTRPELSKALDAFLNENSHTQPVRFCFFIDGLDEYAGEYQELIDDLSKFGKSDVAKVCVSSRPYNAFVRAYSTSPERTFVLQELTKPDMEKYVRGMLEQNKLFIDLLDRDSRAQELVSEIRDKAHGVFLWVFLVVRSLIRGLTEEDEVPDLQQRLLDLPTDLKEFFTRMLESIDEMYKPNTSKMLSLALYHTPLPLMSFHYLLAEKEDPDYAIKAKIEPIKQILSEIEIATLKHRAVTHINKWCRDLLEVFQTENEDSSFILALDPTLDCGVDFLHRTVRDYLGEPEVKRSLARYVNEDFNPIATLCRICLAQAKNLEFLGEGDSDEFANMAEDTMRHAKAYEDVEGRPLVAILDDLDRVGHHYHEESKLRSLHWTRALALLQRFSPDGPDPHQNFLAHAVCYDLALYVEHSIKRQPRVLQKPGWPLLFYALCIALELNGRISFKMVQLLLTSGASPNENCHVMGSLTVWQMFLFSCYTDGKVQDREIVRLLLRHGAEWNARIPISKTSYSAFAPGSIEDQDFDFISKLKLQKTEFASPSECLVKAGIEDGEQIWREEGSARQKKGLLSWLPAVFR